MSPGFEKPKTYVFDLKSKKQWSSFVNNYSSSAQKLVPLFLAADAQNGHEMQLEKMGAIFFKFSACLNFSENR